MTLTRRRFIGRGAAGLGALALGPLALPALAQGEIMPTSARRVVVVGGGWGGNTAAKYIRMQDPAIEVVLIEKGAVFRSCPISNWVIGGLRSMDDITVGYDGLAANHGVKVMHDVVTGIDTGAKTVAVASGGFLRYDRLVMSPGITLLYDAIEGLGDARDRFPAAWKAGAETQALRERLQAMPAGGTVALSIPPPPYRCPPGPYERISLIADYLKRDKPGSKLVVFDANQKIVSKGALFKAAWDEMYADIIDYRTDHKVIRVDPARGTIYSDFDEVTAEVANVIPPQQANRLAHDAGLVPAGRNWAPVNPWDFTSTEAADVHVIGDATDGSTVGAVPKSGFIANAMGKIAAGAAVALLNGREAPRPSLSNTCYSLVSADAGISVTAIYDYDDASGKIAAVEGASGLSPTHTPLIKRNAEDWALAIWRDMLA